MEKNILSFYNSITKVASTDMDFEKLKKEIFSLIVQNNLLYKYISFTQDDSLNSKKLMALRENKLWFSAHYMLENNDPTEFQIPINYSNLAKFLCAPADNIFNLIETFRELNDLCCPSNRYDEYMWENYANNHSGCCCVFEIKNYEMLWPVIYCDKSELDFTQDIIQSFENPTPKNPAIFKIAFVSPVLKDKKKYGREHEVRLLCGDIYDCENDALGGRVMSGKKRELGYTGTYYTYEKCGLILKKIIIGANTSKTIASAINEIKMDVPIEMEKIVT